MTANGILVESLPVQGTGLPLSLAIWDPSTNQVRIIGNVWRVIGTYPVPGAGSSIIAWIPGDCHPAGNCPLQLTDSSTLTTRSVLNPLGQGFEWGGGFSPDGSTIATFIPGPSNLSPTAQLVLISTSSGSVRIVPQVTINNGDSLAWAQWFPDNRHLIAGGIESPEGRQNDNHYLVDASTGRAELFSFYPGGGYPDGSLDVNFSVTTVQ